jgi:hypothetical protein
VKDAELEFEWMFRSEYAAVLRTVFLILNDRAHSSLFVDEGDEYGYAWASEALGARWSGFAIVNQRWLELVLTEDDEARLVDVPQDEIPQSFLDEFAPQLDLWTRSDEAAESALGGFDYLTPVGGPVPLVGLGGELEHRDDVLVVLVPDTWATFNDSFLMSAATGMNLLFTGLDETQALLESHGLAKEIKVQHAADDGILLAQFAAREAWLAVVSMIGLAVALVVAAWISAYIAALLQAKNDFARRLAGHAWLRVLSGRVVPEVALGALVALVPVILQPPGRMLPVVVAAVLVLVFSPLAHVLAARQGFADVGARRL